MRKSLKEMVEEILRCYPTTRNSDKILCIQLWESYYDIEQDRTPIERIFYLPSQETIGRIRRKFQEIGQYLPTDKKVVEKRAERQTEYRKEYGHCQTLAQIARMDNDYAKAVSFDDTDNKNVKQGRMF